MAAAADRAFRKLPPTAVNRLLFVVAVAALAGCGGGDEKAAPPPLRFETLAGTSPVARGERLGRVLGCAGCHGEDLTGIRGSRIRAWRCCSRRT
jgi:cytochrome c553